MLVFRLLKRDLEGSPKIPCIVVSDAYPIVTALAADLILPSAMWVERRVAVAMLIVSTDILEPRERATGCGGERKGE
jgi:anaerobic selenocysteine-containing dehydrogenase